MATNIAHGGPRDTSVSYWQIYGAEFVIGAVTKKSVLTLHFMQEIPTALNS
jgi:hypothetical protein